MKVRWFLVGTVLGEIPHNDLDMDMDLDELNLIQSRIVVQDKLEVGEQHPPTKCRSAGNYYKSIQPSFSNADFYVKSKTLGVFPYTVMNTYMNNESKCHFEASSCVGCGIVAEFNYMEGFNGWSTDITGGQ